MKRAGTGFGDGAYSLPSGHMDGGETAARAAQREAAEELGAVPHTHTHTHAVAAVALR
jgi:8-oxo-dGTP diphosphatase